MLAMMSFVIRNTTVCGMLRFLPEVNVLGCFLENTLCKHILATEQSSAAQ